MNTDTTYEDDETEPTTCREFPSARMIIALDAAERLSAEAIAALEAGDTAGADRALRKLHRAVTTGGAA